VSNVIEVVLRVLLCPSCAACGAPLQHPLRSPVCDACWLGVAAVPPPRCRRCGDHIPAWRYPDPVCARCRRHPPAFSIARSAGRHDGSLRQIVHAFKYQHRRALAGSLARLMRAAGDDLLADADAVVPVPLHPWRRLQRGFNQADDLARHLNRPVVRALRRRRHGPPQASLPAARRHVNLRQAYATSLWCLVPGTAQRLRGATIVLVDDVMTTGATLDACARVLRTAGVSEVRALTAARAAVPRQPPPLTPPDPSTLPR
jgi:ComF family protein